MGEAPPTVAVYSGASGGHQLPGHRDDEGHERPPGDVGLVRLPRTPDVERRGLCQHPRHAYGRRRGHRQLGGISGIAARHDQVAHLFRLEILAWHGGGGLGPPLHRHLLLVRPCPHEPRGDELEGVQLHATGFRPGRIRCAAHPRAGGACGGPPSHLVEDPACVAEPHAGRRRRLLGADGMDHQRQRAAVVPAVAEAHAEGRAKNRPLPAYPHEPLVLRPADHRRPLGPLRLAHPRGRRRDPEPVAAYEAGGTRGASRPRRAEHPHAHEAARLAAAQQGAGKHRESQPPRGHPLWRHNRLPAR
mmetsp:Transcript_69140/g.200207  ORF Transcript_69140/g.200207 Transcript_69140/m.200207 type:complete len:303 (+) Transcript_69140:929-1837(+)